MFQAELITRFTNHLKEALQKALSFTLQQGRGTLEPGDLLIGLLKERGCIGGEILIKAGITHEQAEQHFKGLSLGSNTPLTSGSITLDLSQDVKHVLEKSVLTAHFHEHKYIGTEHLLFALLDLPIESLVTFFRMRNVSPIVLRGQVVNVLKSTSRFPDVAKRMDQDQGTDETTQDEALEGHPHRAKEKKPKALEVFARELSSPALADKLDPVIGRDAEIDRVTEILCRRTKNNPILLGEPGVGKTAIAEGLAKRLAANTVPGPLKGKRLFAIDLALLIAGTMYRGEFEARLKQIIDEAKEDPNVILFIDEIHTIVGAGSTSGSLDAANMLKPALARGEVRCIGATTWNEYKKHIEPDAALERRYQPVDVPEPNKETTRQILDGLKERYETHHNIIYHADALDAAVRLAERYLTDRFFPDKAIDLLDEAAAHVNNRRPEQALTASGKKKKAKAIVVEASDIASVVARLSRVPLSSILLAEREALRGLEARLGASILGQAKAVQAVAEAVQRSRLGLSDPRRPKASFLFVGPSGVGKTELARVLAKELFGKEDALHRLDMSEFSEAHTVSKLLGSPAGYVGYREQNRLTDTLRKRPNSVLLLDEFEKAHPDVQHLLLQILEEGQLTDGTGKSVSLRNAYVVVTGNVGADQLKRGSLGFGQTSGAEDFEARVQDQLKERFRPELLNRFDRVVVFNPLAKDAIEALIRRETQTILDRARETHEISYRVSQEVFTWLTNQAKISEEGGRAARRVVEKDILPLVANALLTTKTKKNWQIKVKEGKPQIA